MDSCTKYEKKAIGISTHYEKMWLGEFDTRSGGNNLNLSYKQRTPS